MDTKPALLAEQIRSGLVETSHDGAVAVVGPSGTLEARHGDIDRPFFIRSSAKPFQAFVSQRSGANLTPLELAMACASHRGFPVHVALVMSMLAEAGLDESALRCPASWPASPIGARDAARRGAQEQRRVWHNCSGKHSGFLRACVANGWPLDTYLSPEHPLQRNVVALVSEAGDFPVGPVGVDGCGAPVMRTTARAMATMYARLATEDRFAEVFATMHQYPALIAANGEADTTIAVATHSVAKGGAAGCMGVGVADRYGIGVKSWDGLGAVAGMAAAATLSQLGVLSMTAVSALDETIHPPVLGGGARVGQVEPRFELAYS